MGVAGTYECVVKSPLGDQKSTMVVNVDGDSWTGTNSGAQGSVDITDGKIGGELRAECRRCNRKAGGRRSVELRKKRRQPTNTARRW